ncbi:MAG TPA: amidohydrolase family protein [Methanomassiliicoccales archaeon]|nr:amidohydrolase family protein [Methanomassiliicoccales archaeon]
MIIDAHVHLWQRSMYPDVILDAYVEPFASLDALYPRKAGPDDKDWLFMETDPEVLIDNMKSAGIDRSVVLPLDFGLVGPTRKSVEELNEWVFEASASYADKLIPFIGVDPQRGYSALRIVEDCVKRFDARGVKVYPPTGWRPDDERIAPFWMLADELGLMIVSHSGAVWGPLDEDLSRPSHFASVLDRYENMTLVIAHLGGKFHDELWPLLEKYPNAYTDCSALQGWFPSSPEMIMSRLAEMATRAPERVFFGTDWPLFDLVLPQAAFVDLVGTSDWGDRDMKERLFSGNFTRALRRH